MCLTHSFHREHEEFCWRELETPSGFRQTLFLDRWREPLVSVVEYSNSFSEIDRGGRDELTGFGFAISKYRLRSDLSCATVAVDNKSRITCCGTPSAALAERNSIVGLG